MREILAIGLKTISLPSPADKNFLFLRAEFSKEIGAFKNIHRKTKILEFSGNTEEQRGHDKYRR